MNSKIKILMLSLWYPLTMSKYFERAFRRRDDVELLTTGPYTGNWIPWKGGMSLPMKYAVPPDVPMSFGVDIGEVNYEYARAILPPEWIPDLVITVDAGIHWKYKPTQGIIAHVATDPHVLDYEHQRHHSDKFFNMQRCYMHDGDIYLPYAYDPTVHYYDPNIVKDTDAVLGGMPYAHRVEWVNALRDRGVSVLFENGPIFDEYREMNNRASIGLNWSSMNDMNARVFELAAMRLCPVMNDVPDLHEFFVEGKDYLGFRNLDDAIEKVIYAKQNQSAGPKIAESAYYTVRNHTYDNRVNQILKECGLI
jgi:Glycosyl transferases group 1